MLLIHEFTTPTPPPPSSPLPIPTRTPASDWTHLLDPMFKKGDQTDLKENANTCNVGQFSSRSSCRMAQVCVQASVHRPEELQPASMLTTGAVQKRLRLLEVAKLLFPNVVIADVRVGGGCHFSMKTILEKLIWSIINVPISARNSPIDAIN